MQVPPKKKYEKNFLKQVIAQIVYEETDRINEDTVKAFKVELGDSFGTLSAIKQQGIIIRNDGSNVSAEPEDSFLWEIKDDTKNFIVRISTNSLSITFSDYTKFSSNFEATINTVLDTFMSTYAQIEELKRIGLRYVNQISIPGTPIDAWAKYINPKMIGYVDFVEKEQIRRSMQSVVVRHSDTVQLNINYGIYNQYFPSEIKDGEFILDIDAYSPYPVETDECKQQIKEFNSVLAIYFENFITDDLRKYMGVIDE
jgi:uncharacterized protein (TIGR04255 family)